MNAVEVTNKEMQGILEKFDYTQWQQEHFDALTPEQINSEARQYAAEHPFKGKAEIVL